MQNADQANERFSKRLTQNEVEKGLLSFAVTAIAAMFAFQKERVFWLDVVGRSGKTWTLMALFQTTEDMGPVFTINCVAFVRDNALKANDELIFVRQAQDDNGKAPLMKLKVEVRRKIRLFGKDIWGDLMV